MEFALPQGDDAGAGLGQQLQAGGQTHKAVGQSHAGGEGGHVRRGQVAVHAGKVALVHMVAGAEEPVGQLAVVGQQQQTLGVLVQPSHRGQPLSFQFLGQQVQHGPLPAVLHRRQDPRRLVQQHIGKPPVAHCLPVHPDVRRLRVDLLLR